MPIDVDRWRAMVAEADRRQKEAERAKQARIEYLRDTFLAEARERVKRAKAALAQGA